MSRKPIWSARGDNPLLLWLRRKREAEYQEAQMVDIAMKAGADVPDRTPAVGAAPGDPWLLRGIPVVGVHGGVGGAQRGTRPGDGLV